MLAFSQNSAHNTSMTPVLKPITRIMYAGTPDQKIISIRPNEKSAMLVCGDNTYWLVPANIPNEYALMRILEKETIETYITVVSMLQEMAA